jgi:hypothetical protein
MLRRLQILIIVFSLIPLFLSAEADLAGKWKLDKSGSDDPAEKMKEALAASGNIGNHRGGAGMRMRRPEDRKGKGPMEMLQMPQLITVEYRAPELKINGDDGKERIYYTDGRKNEKEVDGPRGTVNLVTIANWQEDQLVVETRGQGGMKTVSTYELVSGGKQLYITTQIQPLFADEPILIRLIYDRVD